jgi:hypothetical protein
MKNLGNDPGKSRSRGHEDFTHIRLGEFCRCYWKFGCGVSQLWCGGHWKVAVVSLNTSKARSLNSKYCPGRNDVSFSVPLNKITALCYTKAGTEILSDIFEASNKEKCCGSNLTVAFDYGERKLQYFSTIFW